MGSEAALFFKDLALIFAAAVAGGLVARKLQQPLILGYVIGGILISPFTPGPSVSDLHSLEVFAEIGVVLLMFSIGIEFSPRDLMRVKWVSIFGGPLGVVLSMSLGAAVAIPLGWDLKQGIVIGAVISVASTMVLVRLLMERGELRSEHGRVMIGITLVEDVVVVGLTVALPAIARLEPGHLSDTAMIIGKAALILIPLGLAAAWLVPRFLARIAALHNQELFLIVILTLCLGTAAITQAAGLSLALGAFVAGLVVSGSEYTREALGHLLPLRDAFVALFFVTIGMLIDPGVVFGNLPLLLAMVGLTMFGKFFIGLLVVKMFGYSIWTAALAALGRTQIGEFSFVLVQVARQAKLVGDDVYNATLAASLVTILLNAAVVKFGSDWLGKKRLRDTPMRAHDDELKELSGHIVVCGFGRMGGPAGTAFNTFNLPFVVIEIDPEVVRKAREKNIHCLYGDPAHRPVLEGAHTDKAALVIVTLPEADRAYLTVRNIREINPTVPILARAHRRPDFEALLLAGATRVVQPEVEASATLIGDALHIAGIPHNQVEVYMQQYREAMKLAQSSPLQSPGAMPELQLIPVEKLGAAGLTLRESNIREQFGLTVVAIRRASGENVFNPPATTRLEAGDQVQVLGLTGQ
ncbi:MAG TPA: cation:proton antiporter [Terriglobales bacterium]|nr:cation:proton antiporter [Terriglobales bacterium]